MTQQKRSARAASKRQLRVGEQLRHIISAVLIEGNIHDPDLVDTTVTVTEVQPSPDMRNATVYVIPLGGLNEDKIVKALNRSSGFIQEQMGRQLSMKFTPRLSFKIDDSFEYGDHIDQLIRGHHKPEDQV
ncbi:30S ribosome-binding factor RbfA [Sneathiella chinensis]|uniref:Ribosome-binding factor A n=1 Tax=Sneathiella chinensis TaxID=349750 RepID=A0ABQ5U0J8_9PROT|nr:30S ribosome-binding factor RbfA [Sneathiella chinensis]GLQ05195.1 ribosome-binding factor A [Sneathiella chinensis]